MADIRNRIVELRTVLASDLRPDERNWRRHPKAQRTALQAMLERVGYADALIARETPDGLVLVDGHLRADLDPSAELPVLIVDLDDEEAGAVLATLDPLAAMAKADMPALAKLAQQIKDLPNPLADMLGVGQLGGSGVAPTLLKDQGERGIKDDGTPYNPEHAKDVVGFDLNSVWGREGDGENPFAEYVLSLPRTENGINQYSRSPMREMLRIVQTYLKPGDFFLEACAGWLTFSWTAACMGYSGKAIDIWDTAITFADTQRNSLPYDVRDRIQLDQGDALNMPYDDGEFDIAYCNPPFARLEVYSDSDNAIENNSYDEWLNVSTKLLAEMGRVVKPGALIITVMADSRENGVLKSMHSDWMECGTRAGLLLHDIAIQHLISAQGRVWRHAWNARRTAKAHEYIITFRRPEAQG